MDIKFIKASDIAYSPKITLVNALADLCQHCQELKKHLPELEAHANSLGVSMYHIEVNEENKAFFEAYQNETIPYTFVFDNGNFVGGDSFDKNSLLNLINALGAK